MCTYVQLTENALMKLDPPQQLLPKVPIQLIASLGNLPNNITEIYLCTCAVSYGIYEQIYYFIQEK